MEYRFFSSSLVICSISPLATIRSQSFNSESNDGESAVTEPGALIDSIEHWTTLRLRKFSSFLVASRSRSLANSSSFLSLSASAARFSFSSVKWTTLNSASRIFFSSSAFSFSVLMWLSRSLSISCLNVCALCSVKIASSSLRRLFSAYISAVSSERRC